jgi:hypothetical protein
MSPSRPTNGINQMSIDARVDYVHRNDDGSGRLKLIDRPARRGQAPGIKGQPALTFAESPADVTSLQGANIWGNDSIIMLGDRTIARRVSITEIRFVPDEQFSEATEAYRGD